MIILIKIFSPFFSIRGPTSGNNAPINSSLLDDVVDFSYGGNNKFSVLFRNNSCLLVVKLE